MAEDQGVVMNPYARCLRHQDCIANRDVAYACVAEQHFSLVETFGRADMGAYVIRSRVLLRPHLVAFNCSDIATINVRINQIDGLWCVPASLLSATSTARPSLPDLARGDMISIVISNGWRPERVEFFCIVGEGPRG